VPVAVTQYEIISINHSLGLGLRHEDHTGGENHNHNTRPLVPTALLFQ
jgi:hypothetical protein